MRLPWTKAIRKSQIECAARFEHAACFLERLPCIGYMFDNTDRKYVVKKIIRERKSAAVIHPEIHTHTRIMRVLARNLQKHIIDLKAVNLRSRARKRHRIQTVPKPDIKELFAAYFPYALLKIRDNGFCHIGFLDPVTD